MRRIVVVGASLAGVHAAEGLRDLGFDGLVTLLGAEAELPYDRPPLSKEALRLGRGADDRLLRARSWYDEHGIELHLGQPAQALDPATRTVTLRGGEELAYDGLIIATGSAARHLDGHHQENVHVLRTADDALRLHSLVHVGTRLVIVGAGFIGLEVAATATAMGAAVTIVEIAPVPLSRVVGDEVGRWLRDYHAARGVDIRCATRVGSIERCGAVSRVQLSDGSRIDADVVVAGVGARPAVEWLAGSGLDVSDGIVCDPYLRTGAPGVVAAGDVARWHNRLFDQDMRVEQWTNAVEQGRYAASSVLGAADTAYASVPYFWSDQFSARIRFVGTSTAAEDVHVEKADSDMLVALFGRDGLVRGALCINAPRNLARYQAAITSRMPWHELAPMHTETAQS